MPSWKKLITSGSDASLNSLTVINGITGSLFGTASFALQTLSSSFAQTASFAPAYLPLSGGVITGNVTVNGTASISFLNVTIESASVIYSSGSNQFGDATNDTQTLIGTVIVSGSQRITGSLNVTQGITGSLFGTASFAISSSRAISASWAPLNAGGSNTQIQFNSGSSLLGTGSFTFNYQSQSLQQGLAVIASGLYSHAEGLSTIASGSYSHAEGYSTTASGVWSHAEGQNTRAIGNFSHAEGDSTQAIGASSHAEGYLTQAIGNYSHAEGESTIAHGDYSHAEGLSTIASGSYSHTEGYGTGTTGSYSHAEGYTTLAIGQASHAEGFETIAIGDFSHAEGASTQAIGQSSHAEGNSTYTGIQTAFISATKINNGLVIVNGDVTANFTPGGYLYLYDEPFENTYNRAIFEIDTVTFNGVNFETFIQLVDTNVNANEAYFGDLTYLQDNGTFGSDQTIPGPHAHSEGDSTIVSGVASHAEGKSTKALGNYTHAEGTETQAIGSNSHAEGASTQAIGASSHAEGNISKAIGDFSHAEGQETISSGSYSHAEGYATIASGSWSHAEGYATISSGNWSHAEGVTTTASGSYSHAEGYLTQAIGEYSHAEGKGTIALGNSSHAEGRDTQAIGEASHAEGDGTLASGNISHAEGKTTISSGSYSHAEGVLTLALEEYSHAEGSETQARGYASHAEGLATTASGSYSHAEGRGAIALGNSSHAEGRDTQAIGIGSHAEGLDTRAIGDFSHAEGSSTVASGAYQHVQGQYNISSSAQSAFIIGNGTANNARSNLVFASGSTFQITGSLNVSGSLTISGSTNAFLQNGNSFGTTALLGTNDNQSLALETSGSVRMFISSSGDIGIGTITPSDKLSISAGNILIDNGRRLKWVDGSFIEGAGASSIMTFRSLGNYYFNGGNVGIGTISPNAKLDVSGSVIITGSLTAVDTTSASGSLSGSLLDLRQTWNTTGAPSAIRLTTIDTASSGSSKYIEIFGGVGGVTPRFAVSKTSGTETMITLNGSNVLAQGGGFTQIYGGGSGTGFYNSNGSILFMNVNSVGTANFTPSTLTGSTSSSILNLSQTWNTTGNPAAIRLNVTNTASGTTSKLLDLQVGGVSQVVVDKSGNTAVGLSTDTSTARLQVRGTGATSATNTLILQNSSLTNLLTVRDDGSSTLIGRLNITPTTSTTSSLVVTGPTLMSGSSNTISGSVLTVVGSGSAQPVFTVQGSQGELFSVTDSLSGSLFSVNDISGLPIVEVFSDGTTLMGNYLDPMLVTTAKNVLTNSGSFTVYSLPTASYDTAFYDYSVRSGSNARAGQIMAIQSGSVVNYTETTTMDFGSTTGLSLGVFVSGSNMVLTGSAATSAWTVKTIIRSI